MNESDRTSYWIDYFRKLQDRPLESEQLGFSNEAVMVQSVAFVLEACGTIAGKNILDCGCGTGRLARVLDALDGNVTAFDPVGERISELASRYPTVVWAESTIDQWCQTTREMKPRRAYDVVVANEVLQHVGVQALSDLFELVAPGGRLVVTVPNADCEIIVAAEERFDGHYTGVSLHRIRNTLGELLPGARFRWRGYGFQADQSTGPYCASDWDVHLDLPESARMNRILFVAFRP